ncbi:unnamed protein product [Umbelopsis vinacea]
MLPKLPLLNHTTSAQDKKDRLGPERGESQFNPEIPNAAQDTDSNSKNDEYFSFQNFYEFRQARSDHVMGRLRLHFRFNGLSIRRLQPGHYILHQSSPEGGLFDVADTEANQVYSTDEWTSKRRAVMARFGSAIAAPKTRSKFIPYSFSLGARYCSPYRVHDILLRCAHLPNWAHTIFIWNCISYMKENGPMEPGKAITGLFFPFAPAIDVTFRWLTNDYLMTGQEPFPLALLIYEHLGFDTTEEQDMDMLQVMDGIAFDNKKSAKANMKLARFPILWVELGDGMAQHLTGLANHWREKYKAEGGRDEDV